MTKPRFEVGQMVVLVAPKHAIRGLEFDGHVGTVKSVEWRTWGIDYEPAESWAYYVTGVPTPTAEPHIRPYYPTATWADCVWQPEALKETEEAV